MVAIEIETVGDERFVRAFTRYGGEVQDWTPVFRDIYEDFRRQTVDHFAAQGAGRPARWRRLSPRYAEWKANHFRGKPILRRTDEMYNSLLGHGHHTVKRMDKLNAEFGTSDPKAAYHQRGTGRLPQRKVVHLTEADKRRWSHMIHEWAYRQAGRA